MGIKIITWGLFGLAFTGTFIKGWFSGDLWEQILVGALAVGSWLGFYSEYKKL